jgi:Predicted hydrolases or acyltransferases (alpha/beta hydrolase superfamily)
MKNKSGKVLKIGMVGILSVSAVSYFLYKQLKSDNSYTDYTTDEYCVVKNILDGNQQVFYYIYGDTSKDLIFLIHPAFGDHQCFYHQIEPFAKDYCVICIDLVGHGRSQVEDISVKIDKSASHMAEIMKKENFEHAHLVGVSLGALIAQHFSLNYPQKTKTLTALGAYDINTSDSRFSKSYKINSFATATKVLFSMDSFRQDMAEIAVIKKPERERFFKSANHFKHKSFTIMTTLNKISKPRAGIIYNHPLLILCGDQDNPLALHAAQSWKESYPESEYIVIQNAGHCANMDNPFKFNDVVLSFINKHRQ